MTFGPDELKTSYGKLTSISFKGQGKDEDANKVDLIGRVFDTVMQQEKNKCNKGHLFKDVNNTKPG